MLCSVAGRSRHKTGRLITLDDDKRVEGMVGGGVRVGEEENEVGKGRTGGVGQESGVGE